MVSAAVSTVLVFLAFGFLAAFVLLVFGFVVLVVPLTFAAFADFVVALVVALASGTGSTLAILAAFGVGWLVQAHAPSTSAQA